LVHSEMDQSISYENMDRIYQKLGTRDKTKVTVKHSGHVIIREPDRDQVFKATVDFIQRVNKQK
ncbi:MAG: hypothetical protein JXR32_01885, partial [Anaerolineaceae bacterium]|nr:hypothetical protein [Anaerolineaceae bacterium]